MNLQEMKKSSLQHMDTKGQFFSKQGLTVVNYILGRMIKYNGEFFELNETISKQTGVSVRTIQRTIKRMQELEIISVQARRKVCPITNKTVQSSNLVKLLPYKTFKVNNEIVVSEVKQVEVAIEVIEEVKQGAPAEVPTKNPVRPTYNKRKPIRVEQVPTWLNQEPEVKKATPEEIEEMKKLLGIAI